MSDETKPEYPEVLGTPLVNVVLQDVMASQFQDRLDNGNPADIYADGNSIDWLPASHAALKVFQEGRENGQTHVDLVLAQAYRAASVPDDGDYHALYRRVIALAGYAADWAEDLEQRGWRQ